MALPVAHEEEVPFVSPEQRYYTQLMEWDHDVVKRYMVQKAIYPKATVDQAEIEYKRWLALVIANHGKVVPISAAVDPFWHTNILFTQDYEQMCLQIAGFFIHHRPSILDDQKVLDSAFKVDTLVLYRRHFGRPDLAFWDSAVCMCANNE